MRAVVPRSNMSSTPRRSCCDYYQPQTTKNHTIHNNQTSTSGFISKKIPLLIVIWQIRTPWLCCSRSHLLMGTVPSLMGMWIPILLMYLAQFDPGWALLQLLRVCCCLWRVVDSCGAVWMTLEDRSSYIMTATGGLVDATLGNPCNPATGNFQLTSTTTNFGEKSPSKRVMRKATILQYAAGRSCSTLLAV